MLKDVREKVATNPRYLMAKSEYLLDFFIQLLPD